MEDLQLAATLVRDAGTLAASMLAAGLETMHKTSISDVVSAADHAAEKLVVDRLREARPDDGLLGEEGTDVPGERRWVIDPVDGTYNFLAGIPIWCSAIALEDEDGALLGAIYHPAGSGGSPGNGGLATGGELWTGGRNEPALRNGVPLPPLEERPLAEISISTYLHPTTLPDDSLREPLLRAMQGAATVRMLGSGSVEMAAVAAGRLGAWVHANTKPWDWLPGATLVRAAGGAAEVVEAHGQRWHIAGNKRAVDEALELVMKP